MTNHAPVIIVYVPSIAGPVRLGALLRGYAAAYGRLVTAMQEPDELAAFAPLFETLTWAVTIDDAAGPTGSPRASR